MSFLTTPSAYYQSSYLEALREYQLEGRKRKPAPEEIATCFDNFIQQLHDQADDTLIKPGQVPLQSSG